MKLFPDPKKQADIKFLLVKRLPYAQRMVLILAFFCVGIFVELFFNFWMGCLLLGTGTALSLIKGYHPKPRLQGREKWNQVTPDEFQKVLNKQKQINRWDIDFFDSSNWLGLGSMIFLIILGILCFFTGEMIANEALRLYIPFNCGVLLLPHWLFGSREYLKKDQLMIKIKFLQKILNKLKTPDDVQTLPMMSTRKTQQDQDVPMDVRLMIRALAGPPTFLGLQVQISINTVQGHAYPYLYCVLIAKPESDLFKETIIKKFHHKKIILEKNNSHDVDVLVIRQLTSKTSGYHTNPRAALRVIDASLDLLEMVLDNKPLT